MTGTTLFDKIWSAHTVAALPGNRDAVVIDRMTLHELGGGIALRDMMRSGVPPYMRSYQVFGVADHTLSTAPDRGPYSSLSKAGSEMIQALEESCAAFGYHYGAPEELAQGICHVAGPEQGFVLPGTTHVCCDSHTCTIGAFGTLAFAVGSSEVTTVLKRGSLIIQRPKTLRITINGTLAEHVTAKDVALHILARHGVRAALGAVIEFAGPTVASMSMEARMTLCNMAAEMGTRYALIAPDEVTFDYLRPRVPAEPTLVQAAITAWRGLCSDDDAIFDGELAVDVSDLGPQVTWGTNPGQTVGIGQSIPVGQDEAALAKSRGYMQVQPGEAIAAVPIDAAFIGSCTNGRLSDLRAAAAILQGRRVAPGVHAMCTPGSMLVRAQAEAEGLDKIFLAAGFEWRKAGCSACPGREGPIWADKRVISTTNRNFENRQGVRTRTHLASPATVAASAVMGRIADPRMLPAL